MSNFNDKFNWKKYFDLALELAEINSVEEIPNITGDKKIRSEAKLRASISRAYYAAHCISRNYLRDKLHDTKLKNRCGVKNEHSHVSEELKNHQDRDLAVVGMELIQLRKLRNDADYMDNRFRNIGNQTEIAIRCANHIITTILNKSS